MKRLFFTLIALCAIPFAFSGCSSAKAPTQTDLLHHRFALTKVDGKAFVSSMPKGREPVIEFGEGLRVSGAMCNRFSGQGELAGSTLTAKQLISTKMLCADKQLNQLEHTLSQMLMQGANISLDGKILTLKQGGTTLEYELRDLVQ